MINEVDKLVSPRGYDSTERSNPNRLGVLKKSVRQSTSTAKRLAEKVSDKHCEKQHIIEEINTQPTPTVQSLRKSVARVSTSQTKKVVIEMFEDYRNKKIEEKKKSP